MEWVEFIKVSEDDEFVLYKYSHDCYDHDGTIKIKKTKDFSENNASIIPSQSDISHNIYALGVVSRVNTWIKNDQPLLDKYKISYE